MSQRGSFSLGGIGNVEKDLKDFHILKSHFGYMCCRQTRVEDGLQISRVLQSAVIQVRDDGGLAKEGISGDGIKGDTV